MIRDRLEEDLARLVPLLVVLGISDPERWLTEIDAECSYVFDQAPVTVAPTRNVIGQVLVYRSTALGDDALAVGRLVAAPRPYADNVVRFLLREAVRFAHERGCDAVLGPESAARLPTGLAASAGFVERGNRAAQCLVHSLRE